MKIFVDINKECQIGKVDNEGRHLFKGDENADILKVYFKHETGEDMNWYLTINGILPNGRPIAPRLHDGPLDSETINEEQWYYYQFTLSGENGFNLMKGQITMYIKINYVNANNQVIKEKTIATVNAVVLESSQYENNILLLGDSIENVVFNFKLALESLVATVANDNNHKIVNFLQVLSGVESNLIPIDETKNLGSGTNKWLNGFFKNLYADLINIVEATIENLDVTKLEVLDSEDKTTSVRLTRATIGNLIVNALIDAQAVNVEELTAQYLFNVEDAYITHIKNAEDIAVDTVDSETINAETVNAETVNADTEINSPQGYIDNIEGENLVYGSQASQFKVTPELATYRGSELGTHRELALKYDTSAHNEFAVLMEAKHNQMIQEHTSLANNLQAQINLIKDILSSDDTSLDSFQEIIAVLKDSTADIEALFNQLSTKTDKSYVDAQNELDRAYTDTQVSQARSDFADQMQTHEATTQSQINELEAQFRAFVEQYVGTYPQVIDAMVGDE